MAALSVVPMTTAAPTAMTLYAIEERLMAMADTVEMVPEDQEQAFIADFRASLIAAVDKRDRVGQFMSHLEAQAAFAAAEIKRLQERKATFERALDKMEGYVIGVVDSLGLDDKGKHRKLEGSTVTFSVRACPASVEVKDEAAVPAEYKTLTLSLPANEWDALLDSLDVEIRGRLLDQVKKPSCAVSKTAVKDALKSGVAVPGADMAAPKLSLVRK